MYISESIIPPAYLYVRVLNPPRIADAIDGVAIGVRNQNALIPIRRDFHLDAVAFRVVDRGVARLELDVDDVYATAFQDLANGILGDGLVRRGLFHDDAARIYGYTDKSTSLSCANQEPPRARKAAPASLGMRGLARVVAQVEAESGLFATGLAGPR